MTGKEKCALLREIRVCLAKANAIPYEPQDCLHSGECKGTCYACDNELKDLTHKIAQKKKDGHAIAWDVVAVDPNTQSSSKVNFQSKDEGWMGVFEPPKWSRVREYRRNEPNTFPLIGIDRLRVNTDGPGIRALIAVHGCPLHCKFCINPDSASDSENWDVYAPQDVYEAVKDDAVYYRSTNGGITFGGGEPLMYPEFINAVGKLLPKGLNRWCETSLNVPLANVIACEAAVDHFTVDIKALNPDVYRAYTGGELSRVLENLTWLSEKRGTDAITIRIPIIPGFTDQNDQDAAAQYFKEKGFANIDTFTYITELC